MSHDEGVRGGWAWHDPLEVAWDQGSLPSGEGDGACSRPFKEYDDQNSSCWKVLAHAQVTVSVPSDMDVDVDVVLDIDENDTVIVATGADDTSVYNADFAGQPPPCPPWPSSD